MSFSRVSSVLLAACFLAAPQAHAAFLAGSNDLAGVYNNPRGILDDGSVVAGLSSDASGGETFRWTEVGMAGPGYLPGGLSESLVRDAYFDSSFIVGQHHSGSGTQAFRWTPGSVLGLGDLVGRCFSDAYATPGDGSGVVGAGKSILGMEAFRWTAGGGTIGLGDPPGGNSYSVAEWMPGDGSVVVGFSDTTDTGFEAFIWDIQDLLRTLVDVLIWPANVLIWDLLG